RITFKIASGCVNGLAPRRTKDTTEFASGARGPFCSSSHKGAISRIRVALCLRFVGGLTKCILHGFQKQVVVERLDEKCESAGLHNCRLGGTNLTAGDKDNASAG